MKQIMHRRLQALEARASLAQACPKSILPEWLLSDLVQRGLRLDARGRPDFRTISQVRDPDKE